MENKWKRFLSLLLALVMVIGMMPPIGHVHAEEETVVTLEQVTAVQGNEDYVICFAGTMRAMANSTRAWGNGTGMDTGIISAPSANYIWTLVPAEDAVDGYMLYNRAVAKYMTISMNNAALSETSGDVFKFTHTENGFAIKAENIEYGYFNNLGGTNAVGGWNGDGTKFDIYKVVEKPLDEVDPWGKRFWTKVSVDTETIYNETEGLFEYAWDNNSATIWHSNWQGGVNDKLDAEGETFTGEIDFGKEYTINWFSFTPRQGNNASGLVTQASLYVKDADDADWTQVAQSAAFAADQSEKKISFQDQAVRYVKFVAEASNDGWVAVSEFNIGHEHTEPEPEPEEPENAFTSVEITGITGIASSNDAGDGSNIEEAFDGIKGETGNYWASVNNANGIEGNEYLIADLGGTYTINKVQYTKRYDSTALYNCTGNLNDYIIWVSTDGNTWTQVANGTTVDGTTEITFSAVQASYVKLTATSSYHWQEGNRNKVMTVGEFEVFKAVCATHTPGADATCTTAQTCTVCYAELAPATGHTTVTTGAQKPTLCEPGKNGTTVCTTCNATLSEDAVISQLPVATVLNGDKLIALNTCEYTYNGNSFTHIAADGTVYYVKPAAGNSSSADINRTSQLPQSTSAFTGITLDWDNSTTDGTVWINGNGSMHVWTNLDKPYWDKCGSGHGWNANNGTHDLYLFRATGFGTGDVIPGYTQVTSAEGMVSGENYLIAAKKGDDAWYVMHPSNSTHAWDHIALVSSELRTAGHTAGAAATCTTAQTCTVCNAELAPAIGHAWDNDCDTECNNCSETRDATHNYNAVVTAPTCTEAGYTTYTCTCCGDSYTADEVAALGHTECEAVVENEVAATCTTDGSYDTVTYCSVCHAELSRETTTVPAKGHTPSEAVVENNVEPTLNSIGSYDTVVYCTVCAKELSRETVIVPALTGAVAQINGFKYATFEEALEAAKEGDTIVLLNEDGIEITTDTTYDLSGLTVESAGDVFVVTGGTLTLNGSGTVKGGTSGTGSWTAVWANGGHVVINGGTYSVGGDSTSSDPNHQNDVIYTKNGGTVTINGGSFLNDGTVWTLNENDANRGTITVYGGSFQNWNPADNVSEGAGTSFLAEGYCAAEQDSVYTVQAHAYESVVTAPTCTEAGYTTYTCTFCGDSYTADEIAALGHTEGEAVTENEVAATCTTNGSYDTVVSCSVCDAEVSRETITVPAKGHTEGETATENEVAATCTEDGSYDTVTYCSVCDAEVSRETITVPAKGHTEGETATENEVAATCTEDGSYDTVTYCSVCDAEVSRETITVPAKGHTAGEEVIENNVEPTLNSTGSYDTVVYCSVCDEELTRVTTTVPALTGAVAQIGETKYASFQEALEAAQEGDTIVLLNEDGIEITEDTTYDLSGLTVESAGDVFVVTVGTLTLNGGTVKGGTSGAGSWTAIWANGGHVIINGGTYSVGGDSTSPEPNHQNDVIYTKNGGTVTINGGTFLNDGTVWTLNENDANRGTITVNGGSFQNWNPADNISEGAGTSFLADGYCAAEKDGNYTVQAHAYESVVTAPTCTEAGYTTYTCTFCGDSYTADEIAALGHTEGEAVTENEVAATCTTNGSYDTVVSCSVCGEELSRETVTVPATGHSYEAVVTAPTCTEGGYTTYTCSCGDSYTGDETDPLGHDFENGVCTVCGTGIAVNTVTGETYATLAEALAAATAGDTVKLLGDTEAGNVLVYPDVTLDLNGCELTADHVVGFTDARIVDNAGGGKLIVEERNIVLDEKNPMIPLYDENGYIFTKAGFAISQDDKYEGPGIKIKALVCPQDMAAVELLKKGAAATNIQIMIRLSWDGGDGISYQNFVFKDEVVQAVYNSNKGDIKASSYGQMFTMVVTGIENVENLRANIVIVSDTNVERTTNSISITIN